MKVLAEDIAGEIERALEQRIDDYVNEEPFPPFHELVNELLPILDFQNYESG